MFLKGTPEDQLNALQLILNRPQLIGTALVVSLITVQFNIENLTASSAFPAMPLATLSAPIVATVIFWSLQSLFVFLFPMNAKKTIRRSTWDNQYKNNEDLFMHRWGLGTLNFVGCALLTWALMQFAAPIFSALFAVVLFLLKLPVLAAVFVPVALCAGAIYAPRAIKAIRRDK